MCSICTCRLRLALPITAPAGSSARLEAVGQMKASLTSSLSRLQGKIIPFGRYVGTSCSHKLSQQLAMALTGPSTCGPVLDEQTRARSSITLCYMHSLGAGISWFSCCPCICCLLLCCSQSGQMQGMHTQIVCLAYAYPNSMT